MAVQQQSVQHFELGDNRLSALSTSFQCGLKLWRTSHNSQELHHILYFASPILTFLNPPDPYMAYNTQNTTHRRTTTNQQGVDMPW